MLYMEYTQEKQIENGQNESLITKKKRIKDNKSKNMNLGKQIKKTN